MISLLRPGSPVMSEHVPAAMKRAEQIIARAFTGTYGPSLPVAERAEYRGVRAIHPMLGDLTVERDCRVAEEEYQREFAK